MYKFMTKKDTEYVCCRCKKLGKYRSTRVVNNTVVGRKHPEDDHHTGCEPMSGPLDYLDSRSQQPAMYRLAVHFCSETLRSQLMLSLRSSHQFSQPCQIRDLRQCMFNIDHSRIIRFWQVCGSVHTRDFGCQRFTGGVLCSR